MSIYWDLTVKEARDLIASAEKSGHEYVGVQRARAIVEVDEELTNYRQQALLRYPEGTAYGDVIRRPGYRNLVDYNALKQEIYNETP